MLRNTDSCARFLKSARPTMHICSKLYAPNARPCNICIASHAFLQLFSNYAWLCTYARPAMHNPWPPISSLLVFSWPLQPSFLLEAQLLAHHRGFEVSFLRLWIEVSEKSRTSPKQRNCECWRVEIVKLPDKRRGEDG